VTSLFAHRGLSGKMSARSSGSMSKQQLTPPERGSFPLDHDGLCKPLMKHFMACLKARRPAIGSKRDARVLAVFYIYK